MSTRPPSTIRRSSASVGGTAVASCSLLVGGTGLIQKAAPNPSQPPTRSGSAQPPCGPPQAGPVARKVPARAATSTTSKVEVNSPKFTAAERGQLVCIDQDRLDAIERRMSEEACLDLQNEKIAARRLAVQAADEERQRLASARQRTGAERRARALAARYL